MQFLRGLRVMSVHVFEESQRRLTFENVTWNPTFFWFYQHGEKVSQTHSFLYCVDRAIFNWCLKAIKRPRNGVHLVLSPQEESWAALCWNRFSENFAEKVFFDFWEENNGLWSWFFFSFESSEFQFDSQTQDFQLKLFDCSTLSATQTW